MKATAASPVPIPQVVVTYDDDPGARRPSPPPANAQKIVIGSSIAGPSNAALPATDASKAAAKVIPKDNGWRERLSRISPGFTGSVQDGSGTRKAAVRAALTRAELAALIDGANLEQAVNKEMKNLPKEHRGVLARVRLGWEQLTDSQKFSRSPSGGFLLSRLPGLHGAVLRTMDGKSYWLPGTLKESEIRQFADKYGKTLDREGKLGSGSFGTVKAGISLNPADRNFFVAVKRATAFDDIQKKFQKTEWDAWMRLPQEAPVIQRLGAARFPWATYLVGEVAERGDLHSLIEVFFGSRMADSNVRVNFRKRVAHEILNTVRDFHRLGFYHRDLKPSNFVVTSDGRMKLIDFGTYTDKLAVHPRSNTGTPEFRQPVNSGNTALSADVYALGGVFYMLVHGANPGSAYDAKDVDKADTATLDGCVTKMMARDLARRPKNLDEVEQLPYFQRRQVMDDDEYRMALSTLFPEQEASENDPQK